MDADPQSFAALLGVIPALGLPWIAGWLALRAIPAVASSNGPLQIALGFFTGQMLLLSGMTLGAGMTGNWSVWIVLLVLVGAATAGFAIAARRELVPLADSDNAITDRAGWHKPISALLLFLCAAHLSFVAIEIVHRPVFPWDGWLNWMYRAKAWFYADAWLSFDTPAMWLNGVRENAYAVSGRHYPPLLPVTAVWMAIWTGGWSETLVNLPTLCCGLALTLGVYGLAREARLSTLGSAAAAYLFISLPLLGAHLSLAGMSDVWMAGYTGMGFASIFLGLYRRQASWVLLGLVMVVLSRLVKVEGSVWILAALLATALGLRPRWAIPALVVLGAGALIAFTAGIQSINLPLLGTLGIVDGRLSVPLIGSFALADWQLLDDYRDNFLRGGSWHLIWVSLGVSLVLLARLGQWRTAGLVAVMLLSLALALVGIFQFTEQGAWAEDWSAINRLPLHFAPLLALALAAGVDSLLKHSQRPTPIIGAGLTLIALAVFVGAFFWSAEQESRGETGDGRVFNSESLNAVIGSVQSQDDGALQYSGFQDGITVLTTGEQRLSAADASLVTVSTSGSNREAMTLFWRNSDAPGVLQTVFVDQRGDVAIDLAAEASWTGTILELGITAFDDGGTLTLHHIALAPNNAAAQRGKAVADWMTPNNWTQRSVNWIDAGGVETRISLPALLALALGAMALIALPPGRLSGQSLSAAIAVGLACWLVLDARWLTSQLHMARQTATEYELLNARALKIGGDSATRDAAVSAWDSLETTGVISSGTDSALPPIIAIGSEDPAEQFQRLRARYHLLPAAGLDLLQTYALNGSAAEHLLLLKSAFREPGAPDRSVQAWTPAEGGWEVREDGSASATLSRQER